MSETVKIKRVYFVRHGESVANIDDLVQDMNDPLSETGERQALRIAERTQNIDFDILISSDYARAHSTAKRISEACKKEINFSELFREYRRPASFVGQPYHSDVFQAFLSEMRENAGNKDWHFEDAESFYEIFARAKKALAYLESLKEDTVLVVTHGAFLRSLLAVVLWGEQAKPEYLPQIVDFSVRVPNNTAITIFTLENNRWRLMTWNDHAHFAE